ncbi:MAG: hypothetical protein AABW41_04430 [Nanoarchaeota archaeon]
MLNKRIWLLVSVAFLIFAIAFFMDSLNKTGTITALVVQDIDFNSIEQFSSVNKENEVINIKYNSVSYPIKIKKVFDNAITIAINNYEYDVDLRGQKEIDLDKDSIYDIIVSVDNILKPDVSLTMKRISCIPDWYCGYFGNCLNGIETRQCSDLNKCTNPAFKPDVSRPCIESCNDKAKNQDETGIDCGGSKCKPCNTSLNYIYFWASIPIISAFIAVFIGLSIVQLKKRSRSGKIVIADAEEKKTFKLEATEETGKPADKKEEKIKETKETYKETPNESVTKDILNLRYYIEDALKRKFNETQIKAVLVSAGWPENIININIALVKKKSGI